MEYGKTCLCVASAPGELTPLQRQTSGLVKSCALIAAFFFTLSGIFIFIGLRGYGIQERATRGTLAGVTLALVNCSESETAVYSFFRLVKDRGMQLAFAGIVLMQSIMFYSPVNRILKLARFRPDSDYRCGCLSSFRILV